MADLALRPGYKPTLVTPPYKHPTPLAPASRARKMRFFRPQTPPLPGIRLTPEAVNAVQAAMQELRLGSRPAEADGTAAKPDTLRPLNAYERRWVAAGPVFRAWGNLLLYVRWDGGPRAPRWARDLSWRVFAFICH